MRTAGATGTIRAMPTDPEGPTREPEPERAFGWGTAVALLVWGSIVLAFSAGGLADVTRLWWLVPLFGLAAPVALLVARHRTLSGGAIGGTRWAERELLGALSEHGELTPTSAAVLTSLTAAEAAKALEKLAREGHLEARAREGAIHYALREGDRRAVLGAQPGTPAGPPGAASAEAAPSPAPDRMPTEHLTERELTILRLVGTGRTNKGIAEELFVAEGTVKAHVASVHRKLGVRSRAEAVSRAADLGLL
jgi:DNA-binding CsgD family transcriptional regulator